MNTDAPVDGVCDAEAARLLPWFVTGRLPGDDRGRVEQHLRDCAVCRADLEAQRRIRAALRADTTVEYAPQAGLAATLARIDELARDGAPAAAPLVPRAAASRRPRLMHWLAAAVVVQAVGIGVLGATVLSRGPTVRPAGSFETLTAPAAAAPAPALRVVFAAAMTVGELKSLLTSEHLAIVAGPSDAGVFSLGPSPPAGEGRSLEASLAALRANPHVLFAEPVAPDGTQRP